MAIRDVLMRGDLALTPSEEKIVRLLLTDYPTSGLGTASSLARRAGVSDPTVVRLVVKLGYDGFGDFQAKLLAEVEARLHSPLLMMEAKRPTGAEDSAILAYLGSVGAALEKSVSLTPLQSYERAARLLMETKGEVVILGGRFSRHIAGMLAGYMLQFRPGVRDLGTLSAQAFDTLADLGRRDVLVVFDYRRYQFDVIDYTRQAAARDVRIVLFTDQWLSPIADLAEVTIVSPLEVASPYDTLAPAMAQMEALVAQIVATLSDGARERIERLEEVRHANAVTLDSAGPEENAARRMPGPKSAQPRSAQAKSVKQDQKA
ncbi:MAG: MurR/RpiR family transcriptional regulator [Mesorhizobium sp.]|uniref:MurR/RpiR family transcriptional regulator n=1 Tax=Mesorhizobium TaxID=68287 RepID=UPI000FE73307|nr:MULTISPECIES: MurR/RpiR family transcriptional regulator [Mesorhizobium]MCF6116982.1 MurR/RpiR family transcriptional regulator [Mesorhizobium muleiense]RWP60685.1 MAG: MurR/RpiR family transcriptional regulator [Mesorhizobium sp.]TIM31821.1 MAG: MurR/RpiR family transcriptional regulator [Mesorhizobium sp.]